MITSKLVSGWWSKKKFFRLFKGWHKIIIYFSYTYKSGKYKLTVKMGVLDGRSDTQNETSLVIEYFMAEKAFFLYKLNIHHPATEASFKISKYS